MVAAYCAASAVAGMAGGSPAGGSMTSAAVCGSSDQQIAKAKLGGRAFRSTPPLERQCARHTPSETHAHNIWNRTVATISSSPTDEPADETAHSLTADLP